MSNTNNIHEGSDFDDFLSEENTLEETNAVAIKRVLAWQLEQTMKKQGLTKTAMAKLMQTSRSQLDRLLDPQKTGISLEIMQRAAFVIGRQLQLKLI